MKTYNDMVSEKAWQKCQANHDKHDRKVVKTVLGDMMIYDFEKYMDFNGYCTGQDDVSRTIDLYGIWEPEETKVIRNILENGDRSLKVIDIGSHIGWFSVMAGQLGYSVNAMEADSENIEVLKLNCKLNGIPVAKTSAPEVTIYEMWIDDTKKDLHTSKECELIKIDIEGAEQYAIRMFETLIKNKKVKHIFMEVSPCFNDSYPTLIQKIVDYGYDVFNLDMTPFNFNYDFNQTNLIFRVKHE